MIVDTNTLYGGCNNPRSFRIRRRPSAGVTRVTRASSAWGTRQVRSVAYLERVWGDAAQRFRLMAENTGPAE